MHDIPSLLQKIESLTLERVHYPPDLLREFNPAIPIDREIYGYLTRGGEAGGYYHWLTLLAKHSEARLIMELGNRHGTSTIALYYGLQPGCHLMSIDIVKDQRYVPASIFQDPRVTFLWGDCLDISIYERNRVDLPIGIDILWSDTVHYHRQLASEFYVYEPLLADEAIIAVDDIHLNDKGRFFKEVPYKTYDLTSLCHGSGFGVIHYIRPSDQRKISKEERYLMALKRSVQVGYDNYWALFNEHEKFREEDLYHPLRKLFRRAAHKFRNSLRL